MIDSWRDDVAVLGFAYALTWRIAVATTSIFAVAMLALAILTVMYGAPGTDIPRC